MGEYIGIKFERSSKEDESLENRSALNLGCSLKWFWVWCGVVWWVGVCVWGVVEGGLRGGRQK